MLKTEMRNPKTKNIHTMSALEIAQVMNEENAYCVRAVEAELPQVAKAIEAITAGMKKGGRLFYIGAGTSGRTGNAPFAQHPDKNPGLDTRQKQMQNVKRGIPRGNRRINFPAAGKRQTV